MRFLIDDALSPIIATAECSSGDIFDRADAEDRIVVSADTDFAALLAGSRSSAPSVILFRRDTERRPEEQLVLLQANLDTLEGSLVEGAIVIIEPERIRIRALPLLPRGFRCDAEPLRSGCKEDLFRYTPGPHAPRHGTGGLHRWHRRVM